jgi:hypothetical protein
MIIDCSERGNVRITMIDYIKEMDAKAATPTMNHLFQVSEKAYDENTAQMLDKNTVQMFHHDVVKPLFLSK